MSLLKKTEDYLSKKVRLPVLKEEFFYPTEASVELEPEHPGEKNIIGTCMRAAYYRYSGEFTGEAYSVYTHWIFLTGKAIEAELIEIWKQMGLWIDNNIKFRSKEHHISGEIDVVIKDQNGKPVPVEIKTYYGYEATKEICGNPFKGINGQPKDQHLLQALLYLYFHQNIFERVILIYVDKVCKNNAEFIITVVKEGESTFPAINGIVQRRFCVEDILARYALLRKFVVTKQLPDRDFELEYSTEKIERLWKEKKISKTKYEAWQKGKTTVGDWNCRYCRYSSECYGIKIPSPEEDTE